MTKPKDKRPVWLLDIDGVINVPYTQPPAKVWAASDWRRAEIGKTKILVAQPVLDFITRMHDSGKVEIRWHTTWREDAWKLAAELGLPHFTVAVAPEVYDLSEPIRPNGGRWWKFNAAWRVVFGEHRPLIWTDDDLAMMHQRTQHLVKNVWPYTLAIAPKEWTALTPAHLAKIEAFIEDNQPKPRQRRAQLAEVQ